MDNMKVRHETCSSKTLPWTISTRAGAPYKRFERSGAEGIPDMLRAVKDLTFLRAVGT